MFFVKEKIANILKPFIKKEFGLEEEIRFHKPPKLEFGDITVSTGFEIAKKLKKNPFEVSKTLLQQLNGVDFIEKVEIKGPGYINIFLKKEDFLKEMYDVELSRTPAYKKIIVEHTNINPNKSAHVGHLRNAVLGDTLVRMLKAYNENVEVQNYIDDTGVQVADVVYGVLYVDKKSIEELKRMERIDYYLWDLYVKVSELSQEDEKISLEKRKVHEKIEKGIEPESLYAETISLMVLLRHLETMKRLNIEYDLLPRESDILKLKFWEKAFEILKEKSVVFYQNEGKNRGCWVMNIFEDGEEREKVIVKSNGTVTYLGKDIAYQMWKFGVLGRDFYYKKFKDMYITTSSPEEAVDVSFGGGDVVYNVIDVRQSYLQNILKKALKKAGYKKEAEHSFHFSYEIVTLSRESARLFGFNVDENKKFVEVSGRKGVGVKADDFIDEVLKRAYEETQKRHPDYPEEKLKEIASAITISAIRYYLLKYTLNSIIIFDIENALKFEGETGPYLLYTYVRAKSIERKLMKKFNDFKVSVDKIDFNLLDEKERKVLWELALLNSQFYDELESSIKNLDPSRITKYGYLLSQKFNYFYNNFKIVGEEDEKLRNNRAIILDLTIKTFEKLFFVLGFKQIDEM